MNNLHDPATIKSILSRHGFTFSKRLGQNFLINPTVCPRIAEMGNAREGYGVIEIGPGIGVLTNELCLRADKVVAIELDSRLIPILSETLAEHSNVKVINADVLDIDLRNLIAEEFKGLRVAICANLPYYITSPIVMKLLEDRLPVDTITTMVQREAAERLCAPLGSREAGAVTVAVDFYSEAKRLFNVSRGSFMPAPQVDSAVIQLKIREHTPDVADEALYFRIVRGIFTQRRKTLSNAVSGSMGIDKPIAAKIIEEAKIDPSARPEALKMPELIALCSAFNDIINRGENVDAARAD